MAAPYIDDMTWEIYDEYQKRRASIRRPLSESAIAWMGSKGFDMRGKSAVEIKRQIAARSDRPDRSQKREHMHP